MVVLSSSLLSFVFCLLVTIFTSEASTDTEIQVHNNTQNYHYCCDFNHVRGNYTANSTYHTNLNTLLSTLTSNTEIEYGFYNSSQGENTDKVYAIGLCTGDIKPDECRNCLNGSRANLTELCPNQKEAIGWYEDEKCMLRYSDRSILDLMETGPAFYANNMDNATDLDQFNKDVNTLLGNLKNEAALGDSRLKYAVGNTSGPDNKLIYGLVQCTPDLSGSECFDCLSQSIERIPIDCCKDRKGGRVVRPSCNMRFETSFLFYGDTAYVSPTPPSSTTTNTTSEVKSNKATIIAIAIAVPVVVFFAVVLIFFFICIRMRKPGEKFEAQQETYDDDDDNEIDISESLQFSFNTIREATNDFSDSNKLGQGGFGAVYKGRLINGQEIAVKRLSRDSGQGEREFKNEVLIVAKLQHRNLVRLLGFCLEGRERLLVYEFVTNKSLDYFIFDQTNRAQLDWEKRYKIIAGTARGILYLHQDSRLRVIHRDLKASNILLDEDMNPKIADFGLARLFVVDQTHADTNRVVGTYGYMAPEYAMHGQFSEKSDVFSFGVLVLEVVSGQRNSGIRHGENIDDLLSFAWRRWKEGRATDIIDPTVNSGSRNEIMRCIHIGLLCVQDNVAARPTMASIVLVLNSHSLSLPLPLEPAFYLDSRTGNLPNMQLWELNSETTRSNEYTTRSAQESVNEASVTEPYPR
ncbi:cysteine-rich receptor-like protein kinase 10 [Glycine soja]|uniref:cysteine-rich receptor-like protein kinase 10 n=1 Tax=Glycine soja TaxID=3848 RepID=UPI001040430B|nr:cysteine-rich receptor-like protein kinase 10 [Glycine soja]